MFWKFQKRVIFKLIKSMSYNKKIDADGLRKLLNMSDWHSLLSALCIRQGHVGNSELAYLFGRKTGKLSQKEAEAAARNLSNWRNGANLPSRANFQILTDILAVERTEELKKHWRLLYSSALQSKTLPRSSDTRSVSQITFFGGRIALSTLLFTGLFIGSVTLTILVVNWFTDEMRPLANNSIVWRKNVTMTVGHKIVVHGKKGACGKMPPSIENIMANLPKNLTTGRLVTGELGLRASNGCNGLTPAREIVFEALAPGRETFFLFENDINVRVTSEPGKEDYEVE